ncbi:hypothetical protein [Planomonospora sp. ID82291]|uniref:hypothetical protein n=1 Tax=Planomonospora sp. ID82291 TaxID=2738136 RepID=UPI0018C383DE|nr:hypothetical protein [Planomonospora sp. ID82291]MBG0817885.1 hypothetical protein [Planomonospora sp. ID82291]
MSAVAVRFGAARTPEVLAALPSAHDLRLDDGAEHGRLYARVLCAIVELSTGDLRLLREVAMLAIDDWRDVLVAAGRAGLDEPAGH